MPANHTLSKRPSWQLSTAQIFWNDIAPADHVMQVYDNEHVFLDTLAGFVGGGINQGDTIVLVATPAHVAGLQERRGGVKGRTNG